MDLINEYDIRENEEKRTMEAVVGEGNRYFKHSINYVDINS